MSELLDSIELLHYRILLGFDAVTLGRLTTCCAYLRNITREPALWQRLAATTDRLSAARYFGVLSHEAGGLVSTESDPPRQHNLETVGKDGVNWRDIVRQLHPHAAVRPWPRDSLDPCSFNGHDCVAYSQPATFEDFPSGALVEAHSLSAEQLNGARGYVQGTQQGRIMVNFGGSLGGKALKPSNLKLLHSRAAPASSAVWDDLTDGWHNGIADSLPQSGLFAGHSPHLFWIGGNHLLAIAGVYFQDAIGGVDDNPLQDVYLLDLTSSAVRAAFDEDGAEAMDAEDLPAVRQASAEMRCRVRARRLDCGTAGGLLPHGHPSMNGTASDFDPLRRKAYFFGGGSPHHEVFNVTSALRLSDFEDGAGGGRCDAEIIGPQVTANWETVNAPGSVEAGTMPSPRQGIKGVVFQDEFVIFGGREAGGACLNDVWSLDLAAEEGARGRWRLLACDGRGPSPRVWYGACHTSHGRWFIYGGSMYQFEEPEAPHDYQLVYMLDLAARSWSSVNPSPGPRPPMVIAHALVSLGSQVLLLGGAKPHCIGPDGVQGGENLSRWQYWYERIDRPHVFDVGDGAWHGPAPRAAIASISNDGNAGLGCDEARLLDIYFRSHLAAAFVPTRRSVVVFGGSRYFTGEYFNDVLELHLPVASQASNGATSVLGKRRYSAASSGAAVIMSDTLTSQPAFPLFMRPRRFATETRVTRGLLGRFRGMVRDGALPLEVFERLLSEL